MLIGLAVLVEWLVVRPLHGVCPSDIPHLAKLQALETGIALVFVPITVFAIGLSSQRTASGVNTAEVLLSGTYLFPVAVFVMNILASFAFVGSVSTAKCLILVTFLLAALEITLLTRFLLDDRALYFGGIAVLQGKLRRSIALAVNQRIGRRILLEFLESLPLEYSPSLLGDDVGEMVYVLADGRGVVHDIWLNELAEFAKRLEECAQRSGYSFGSRAVIDTRTEVAGPGQDFPREGKKLQEQRRRYVMKLYGDPVTERHAVIGSFPRVLVGDETEIERLKQMLTDAVTVKRGESYSERALRSLSHVKDQAVLAIRDLRTSALEDLLGVYSRLADTFLQEMQRLGGGHSFEAAQREAHAPGGGWEEVKWISRQLYELHQRGCRSEDRDVSRIVAAAPNRIAYAAIRARDHLLFAEFTEFALSLYVASQEARDSNIQAQLFDRSWRYLVELANYGVEWEIMRNLTNPAEMRTIADFAATLLLRFQGLLKEAVDRQQADHFLTFGTATRRAFAHWGSFDEERAQTRLQRRLAEDAVSRAERERLEEQLEAIRLRPALRDRIVHLRSEMLFGIGGLALDRRASSPRVQALATMSELSNQWNDGDLTELTALYTRTMGHAAHEFWGWDWFDKIPEDTVVHLDSAGRLRTYYCFLALRKCQELDAAVLRELVVSSDESFFFEACGGGPLSAVLLEFENDRLRWSAAVPDSWLAKIAALRDIFLRTARAYEKAEEDRVMDAVISADVRAQFRRRFVRVHRENAWLRKLMDALGAFLDQSSSGAVSAPGERWGLDQVEEKKFYVQNGGSVAEELAQHHAEDFATAESALAFDLMLRVLPRCTPGAVESAESAVVAAMRQVRESGGSPDLVLMGTRAASRLSLERASSFTPKWRRNSRWSSMSEFEGFLAFDGSDIPVFRVWTQSEPEAACVMNIAKCLRWVQQAPANDVPEEGFFYINLTDLGLEDPPRESILKNRPPWLEKQEDKERYLRQRVWLRIYERFEIKLLDPVAGCRVDLGSNPPKAPGTVPPVQSAHL